MALVPDAKKKFLTYVQKVCPSNPKEGDVWFNPDHNIHFVFVNGTWQLLFDSPIVLGPHTYNINFKGCENEVLARVLPFMKFKGCETETLCRVLPFMKFKGCETEILVKTT